MKDMQDYLMIRYLKKILDGQIESTNPILAEAQIQEQDKVWIETLLRICLLLMHLI